jgi:hypothetical protein
MSVTFDSDTKLRTYMTELPSSRELHCAELRSVGECDTETVEFSCQKRMVKSDVVTCQAHATFERLDQRACDLRESRSLDDVLRGQSMDARWANVALRIDEGHILAQHGSVGKHDYGGHFDDAVVPEGVQPRGFDINNCYRSHIYALVLSGEDESRLLRSL